MLNSSVTVTPTVMRRPSRGQTFIISNDKNIVFENISEGIRLIECYDPKKRDIKEHQSPTERVQTVFRILKSIKLGILKSETSPACLLTENTTLANKVIDKCNLNQT